MSMMNIGAMIDKLVWLVLGIWFIYLSIKQKEKLGKKTALARFGGIVAILYFIFLLIVK